MVKRYTRSRRFAKKVKKTRKALRKNRYMKRVRLLRQKGGFQFDSVSKENEEDAVVTVFPDPTEPEQPPVTGGLLRIRDMLERSAV